MKFVKMSLVAAMLMGASAFAVDNVNISGDARVYYGTNDANDGDLFDKDSSYADTAVKVGLTADLVEGVSAGATMVAVSTLGLENNLVSNTWTGAHGHKAHTGTFPADVEDANWFSEAWIAATLGKTTAKVGRMELDTPLAFSEQWSIASNSFDAAVVLNQDLPDTTLVAAWVGKGNGTTSAPLGAAQVVAPNGEMSTFAVDGAYAYAIVNNSWKPLTVQAWYYDVVRAAQAFWLQGDLNMEGVVLGAQYAQMNTSGYLKSYDDSSAFAVKVGYEAENFSISGAYSATEEDGFLDVSNVATGHGMGSQSKLYTEAWWNYGYIGQADTTAYNITGTFDAGMVGLGAYWTATSNDTTDVDMNELTLEVTKSFGPLDTGLYYIYTDADDQNINEDGDAEAYNTIQVYLTLNF